MMATITSLIQSKILKTLVALALLVGLTSPVWALDLESARSQGLVGETDNGLLALPPGAGSQGQELISTVNSQRRTEYAKIAKQNNIPVNAVGTMMFEKLYPRLPVGSWVQVQGKWQKKGG